MELIKRAKSDLSKESLDGLFGLSRWDSVDIMPDRDFKAKCVKISGFGGQGVLSMGLALAQAAYGFGRFASWYPDYGPKQRCGTSNCSVVISGESIGSPVVDEPDVLFAFNHPSLDKFASDVKKGGLILYDATVDEIQVPNRVRAIPVPATTIALAKGVDGDWQFGVVESGI
ncbi:MAG: 2-oxoacid:acceptor oxidoreductase family protein [Methanotrichaceae archaeon]